MLAAMIKRLIAILCLGLAAACLPASDTLPTLAVIRTPQAQIPLLGFWQTVEGQLEDAQARDTYLIDASAGDNIRLGAVEVGAPTRLTLLDASGAPLASGDVVEARIPADGAYQVIVQTAGDGPSAYTLGLSYTDRPDPAAPTPAEVVVGVPTPTADVGDRGDYIGPAAPGQVISGALTARSARHVYTVQLETGQFFTAQAQRISGTVNPYLRFFSPQGTLLAEDDNALGNRGARLLNVRASQGGAYQLQVSGEGTFGEYSLSLLTDFQQPTPNPAATPVPFIVTPFITPTVGVLPPGTRLTDHAPAIGTIESGSGFSQFSFYADAGDVVTIGVSPFSDSGLRPMFEVFSPEGLMIASARASTSSDGGSASLSGIQIPESGAYLLMVMGENRSLGAFTVSYGRGTSRLDVFRGVAASEQRYTSTLSPRGMRDLWALNLQAGDVITAAVSVQDGGFAPALELTDLDGQRIAGDDNASGSANALLRSVSVARSGQYLLRVRSATGTQIGSYTLIWRYINLAASATPAPLQTTLLRAEGDIAQAGDYHFYTFYGLQGQQVLVEVRPTGSSRLDPVAALLDATGTELATGDDDDGLNPRFFATLPADGAYSLRINGYLTAGSYEAFVFWVYR
jgi:hypothetical protein